MGDILVDATRNTTAGWVTIASSQFLTMFTKLLIHVYELAGAQSIQYRVQGSNNADFDGVETLEDREGNVTWTVAASASDYQTLCDCWNHIRVQVINGDGVGRARCTITGSA